MTPQSELALCSDAAQRVYASILKAASSSSIRTSTVMERLGEKLGFGQIEVKDAVRELFRAGLLSYRANGQDLPISGMIAIVRPKRVALEHEEHWAQVLSSTVVTEDAIGVLLAVSPKLADMSKEDMAVLAEAFLRLSKAEASDIADAGFNVSARAVMGSSKVLANLPSKVLEGMGLPARLQTSSPRYVICAGPAEPKSTLLIENPRAFENAVRSGLAEKVALVCTYGFGLSYLGDGWLQTAAPEDHPIQVIRCGAPPGLPDLLRAERIYLWADLDVAALGIFRSLKTAIPQLRFSSIYKPMMEMVVKPERSHPYAALFEKDGQLSVRYAVTEFSDPVMQSLWEACRSRAVDQEAVTEEHILTFGDE